MHATQLPAKVRGDYGGLLRLATVRKSGGGSHNLLYFTPTLLKEPKPRKNGSLEISPRYHCGFRLSFLKGLDSVIFSKPTRKTTPFSLMASISPQTIRSSSETPPSSPTCFFPPVIASEIAKLPSFRLASGSRIAILSLVFWMTLTTVQSN